MNGSYKGGENYYGIFIELMNRKILYGVYNFYVRCTERLKSKHSLL